MIGEVNRAGKLCEALDGFRMLNRGSGRLREALEARRRLWMASGNLGEGSRAWRCRMMVIKIDEEAVIDADEEVVGCRC